MDLRKSWTSEAGIERAQLGRALASKGTVSGVAGSWQVGHRVGGRIK